jgi:hypothetical protein
MFNFQLKNFKVSGLETIEAPHGKHFFPLLHFSFLPSFFFPPFFSFFLFFRIIEERLTVTDKLCAKSHS